VQAERKIKAPVLGLRKKHVLKGREGYGEKGPETLKAAWGGRNGREKGND